MIGSQFPINFDFQKLSKIFVKAVYIFMKTLTMRILQHWTNPQLKDFYESSSMYFCSQCIYRASKPYFCRQ